MTNFEKIKQMTVEEFAESFGDDSVCEHIRPELCTKQHCCDDCILKWLNQEAEQ